MNRIVFVSIFLVCGFLLLGNNKASAQIAHADSAISKSKLALDVVKKGLSDGTKLRFKSDERSLEKEHDDELEYGIGNVIGKKKKTGKANKKVSKTIKVEFKIGKSSALDFRVELANRRFKITRKLGSD